MARLWNQEDFPDQIMGIRRHSDPCFFEVEEETEEGYIVDGYLIQRDEVAEVCFARKDGKGLSHLCKR